MSQQINCKDCLQVRQFAVSPFLLIQFDFFSLFSIAHHLRAENLRFYVAQVKELLVQMVQIILTEANFEKLKYVCLKEITIGRTEIIW
jgi:hypothetical protein